MAQVLAVKLGQTVEMGMGAVDTGYRAVLAVQFIEAGLQSFRMYGNSLYQLGAFDAGSINSIVRWQMFLGQFKDKPFQWAQLVAPPPNPLLATSRIFYGPVPPPEPPIAEGVMTVSGADYDPLKGWWIEFDGNFDLNAAIFRDFGNIKRLTPDYRIKIN